VSTARPDHDALYHRFFSDPAIVAQLLREFVAGPWLDGLDLDGLERLNTKFHADTGERRESDLVWRIPRRGGGDAYVMLLLEFQSSSDAWMAVRMLVYAGLLWQHLIREHRLTPDGRLPPILPVVLFNGDPRWGAPVDLRELIGLPDGSALWRWQPKLRYHLIDEGAFSPDDLAGRDGLPALLFRLENSAGPSDLVGVADAVLAWFARHPGFEAARRVLVDLLGAAMGRWARVFGCRRSCRRFGPCWSRGWKSGCGNSGARPSSSARSWARNWARSGARSGEDNSARRHCSCASWSGDLACCRTGHGTG
jgi:hypothetical protein